MNYLSKLFAQSEFETIKRDAAGSARATPEQRTAMFIDLMEMVEAIQANLTLEERKRRQRIADWIDPRPDPWWSNIRKDALAEYECRTSLT